MDRHVQCCIAGGGPAGLMLGVLLARAGVQVLVLEKHKDFLRDFRGDTIHPSTMQVMDELGWLDEFLKLPHQPIRRFFGNFSGQALQIADLSHLPVRAKFIAMMPQWDFLNFLAEKGRTYPHFALQMRTEAHRLIYKGGQVIGLEASAPDGPLQISADLVVAADGRTSVLREAAGFVGESFGAPMDVLWFRLPRHADDTAETQGRFDAGRVFVMLNRGEYWQCALVIPKGANERIRDEGLAAFQQTVAAVLPFDPQRVQAITNFDDVKLLTVKVDRLKRWARPGFVCIGDAAHAMSPVGGVGINLAIQDAVAAANIIAEPLRQNRLTFEDLEKIQARRQWPTEMTQRVQLLLQNAVIGPTLKASGELKPPLLLRVIAGVPFLNRLPARVLGLGFRPEHVSQAIR